MNATENVAAHGRNFNDITINMQLREELLTGSNDLNHSTVTSYNSPKFPANSLAIPERSFPSSLSGSFKVLTTFLNSVS